mgnify:CR=1 FL=1
MRSPESKIMTLEEAAAWRNDLRRRGLRLAVTNGCFDLLHRGHAEYLARARACADALLVALNSDASVRAIKGPERPVVREADRAFLVASLEAVDAVVVFAGAKPLDVFPAVRPDIYVKGGDYTEATTDREEYAVLKALGCEFRFIPFVPGFSTTSTISRVRGQS